MKTEDYLRILKDEIHSAVFATTDGEGLPVTRVIDIMLADRDSLYFITAKGKEFYRQLMDTGYVAVSGMTGGAGSMAKKAVSVRGKVRNIGGRLLSQVFEENPYMAEIYPDEGSRTALEVFQIYEGRGEFFDLSTKPITRDRFLLGKTAKEEVPEAAGGYLITERCRGCRLCYSKCPQKCINTEVSPCVILQEHCLHCGNCYEICPYKAVVKRRV